MNSSLALVLQFFFPVLLALGVFEFFALTKVRNSIDAYAAVICILGAIIAIVVFGGITSTVAVVALVLAAYIAATHGCVTIGGETQDAFSAVFYLLVIIAIVAVYLPLVFVV